MGEQFRELPQGLHGERGKKLKERLFFELEIGSKNAAKIQSQYASMGQPAPGRPGNPPTIEPSYELWWNAWQDLSTTRPPGGLATISYTVMADYADRKGLDLDQLKQIIWGLDQEFLDHERKRIERERRARETRKGHSHG